MGAHAKSLLHLKGMFGLCVAGREKVNRQVLHLLLLFGKLLTKGEGLLVEMGRWTMWMEKLLWNAENKWEGR